MKKAVSIFLSVMAAHVLGAAEPTFELVASSTNLVITEQVQVSLVLRLPPLSGEGAGVCPLYNRRPPHVTCPFLDVNWTASAFDRGDPRAPLAPEQMPRRGIGSNPAFTLNNYVSDSISAMMDDPFDMLGDMDPFSRLGPRRQLFPFTAVREKDGSWRLTASAAVWRATTPGNVRLDPVTVDVPLVTGVEYRRNRYNRAVAVPAFSNVVLRTQPLTLTVVEPPKKGRPASWCGAIASNLTVSAGLSTNVCAAGVPLMFTMEVSGAANLSSVRPPDDFAAAFTGTVFQVDAGSLKSEMRGSARWFSWRVKPLKPGTVEFPSIPISYYDTRRRVYATSRTASIPIQVLAAQQAVLMEEENEGIPFPDGIDLDPRGAEFHPLLPHLPLSIALFLLPPVLFFCIRLAPPVRRRIAASNAAYRKAHAFGACRRALKSRNSRRRALAISKFFTVRYGVNGAAVTAADAQRLMAPDYSEEDIALIVTNLQAHDAQAYSAKPGVGTLAVLLAFGLCLGGGVRAEADAARAAFSYQRASMLAVQATDEAGFMLAADAYRDCLDAGMDNPRIYQNLGACLVMASDGHAERVVRAAHAAEAFGCVERRTGETPSTVRGLKAALARQTNNPQAELSPARFFLRPHVCWSVDTRLVIAAALWALVWVTALFPAGAVRRFLLAVFLVAFCLASVSVGVSLAEEHHAREVLHAQN